jgi:hypothetical protein
LIFCLYFIKHNDGTLHQGQPEVQPCGIVVTAGASVAAERAA